MERRCSVLYGEAKRVIETIGNAGRFYTTALKTLRLDFGNPLLISHARLKLLFDQLKIKSADRISLRRFYQQLQINNTLPLSIGFFTSILSKNNLTKAISRSHSFLRRDVFKTTKNSNMLDGRLNFIKLENWLEKKLKSLFNPLQTSLQMKKINKNRENFYKRTE